MGPVNDASQEATVGIRSFYTLKKMPCSLCLDLFTSPTTEGCSQMLNATWPGPPCASKINSTGKGPNSLPKSIYESFSKVHMCLYRKGALHFYEQKSFFSLLWFWGGQGKQLTEFFQDSRKTYCYSSSRPFFKAGVPNTEHILSVPGDIGL